MDLVEVIIGEKAEYNFFKRSEISVSKLHRAIYLKNDGNCCWEIYERENRRGKKESIMLGEDLRPPFKPKAFKKHDCNPTP